MALVLLLGCAATCDGRPGPLEHVDQIVQWGIGRTATTFQVMAIRSSLCAAGRGTEVKVHKLVNMNTFRKVREGAKQPNTAIFVTHITDGDSSGKGTGARFDSGGAAQHCNETDAQRNRRLEKGWNLPAGSIVYAQETAAMATRDWRVIEDHKPVFGLSDDEFGEVVSYIRLILHWALGHHAALLRPADVKRLSGAVTSPRDVRASSPGGQHGLRQLRGLRC